MADRTPRRTTRAGRGRQAVSGGGPPVSAVNVANRGATPASGLTARTRSAAAQHDALNLQTPEDNARIDDMVLAELGPFEGEEPSPLRRLDDVALSGDFEAAYDRRAYAENAGSADSEDEDDIGMTAEEVLDRQQHIADDLAALMDDMEVIGQQINNNNNNNIDNEPSLIGAPAGWKPPCAPENWTP